MSNCSQPFVLIQMGTGARDTTGLFVLAGFFIVTIQVGFIGRWSKKNGDHRLIILDQSTLTIR